jgi:hypothetical protein
MTDRTDAALDELVPSCADEEEDWEDVLARSAAPKHRYRRRTLTLLGPVAIAAAAVLAITSPWQGGPTILQKARAGIGAPGADTVIYERFGDARGSLRLWLQGGTQTRSFRSLAEYVVPENLVGRSVPAAPWGNALRVIHSRVVRDEIGGVLGPRHVTEAYVYQDYTNTLIRFTQKPTALTAFDFDPVARIRSALVSGRARVTGSTMLHGKRVERIVVVMHDADGHTGSATYYADARTYTPVEIVYHHARALEYPYVPVFDDTVNGDVAFGVAAYDYLPATPHNLTLADIRTSHPGARVVCAQEFGVPDC